MANGIELLKSGYLIRLGLPTGVCAATPTVPIPQLIAISKSCGLISKKFIYLSENRYSSLKKATLTHLITFGLYSNESNFHCTFYSPMI